MEKDKNLYSPIFKVTKEKEELFMDIIVRLFGLLVYQDQVKQPSQMNWKTFFIQKVSPPLF